MTSKLNRYTILVGIFLYLTICMVACSSDEKNSEIYKNEKKKVLNNIVIDLKKEHVGVASWRIIYSKNNKILFYNHKKILGLDLNTNYNGIYTSVDCKDIENIYIQGDVFTEFAVSPNGEYAIKYDVGANKNNAYLINFDNMTTSKLVDCDIVTNCKWSLNGKYFVTCSMKNTNSKEKFINLIEIETMKKEQYKVNSNICNYYLDEVGNLLIEENGKMYSCDKNKKEVGSSNDVIGFANSKIIYYKNGYITNNDDLNINVGKGYKIRQSNDNEIIFGNGKDIKVFNLFSSKLYSFNYMFPDNYEGYIYFNNDKTKILTSKSVIDNKGVNTDTPQINTFGDYIYRWFDNKVIRIEQYGNMQGDFQIIQFDYENNQKKVLWTSESIIDVSRKNVEISRMIKQSCDIDLNNDLRKKNPQFNQKVFFPNVSIKELEYLDYKFDKNTNIDKNTILEIVDDLEKLEFKKINESEQFKYATSRLNFMFSNKDTINISVSNNQIFLEYLSENYDNYIKLKTIDEKLSEKLNKLSGWKKFDVKKLINTKKIEYKNENKSKIIDDKLKIEKIINNIKKEKRKDYYGCFMGGEIIFFTDEGKVNARISSDDCNLIEIEKNIFEFDTSIFK